VAVLDAGLADETPELKRYYPTDVLVTGFDIIFFWVARMMMMGLHFMKEVPFRDVYIHAWCATRRAPRCRSRRATSSTRSADRRIRRRRAALHAGARWRRRAATSSCRSSGRGLPQFRDQAVERRALRRDERLRARVGGFDPKSARRSAQPLDRARDRGAPREITRGDRSLSLQRRRQRRLSLRLERLLRLVSRTRQAGADGEDGAAKAETRAMAAWALDEILKLLHPFMPFITEELWAVTAEQGAETWSRKAAGAGPWPKRSTVSPTKSDPKPKSAGWSISSPRSVRCAPK
jgi:valyl-tRNA synthetase